MVYHIVDCDAFTREFLTSQGIDVSHPEDPPVDPYIQNRYLNKEMTSFSPDFTNKTDDTRRRFLEYDGMILAFDATWNEDFYKVMYFLTDDTVAVSEVRRPNDGKDPGSLLLKRTKLPKNWKDIPSSYPAVYMEKGDPEVQEYYTPQDFRVGPTHFDLNKLSAL